MGSREKRTGNVAIPLILAPLALVACEPADGPSNTNPLCGTGYTPEGGRKSDFGMTAAGVKINAILDASASLVTAAREIENDTLSACNEMGAKLSLTSAELAPP